MLYTITILIIELETRKGLDVPKVRTYVFLFLPISYPWIHARFDQEKKKTQKSEMAYKIHKKDCMQIHIKAISLWLT